MKDINPADVAAIIAAIPDEQRTRDASDLLDLMRRVTGEPPVVWGPDTIGFGRYHYRYTSGQEGDFFMVGFSPRKDRLTLYLMSGLRGFDDILERLGVHRASKSAVHIKRLDDVEHAVLEELIEESVAHLARVEEALGAIPRMGEIPPRRA